MKPVLFQRRPRGYGVEALIAAKGQNCVWINEILSDGPQRIDCKPSMVCSRRVLPPFALSKHQGSDSNPKAAAVSSLLFIMMKSRLLCGGMTFSHRGFKSNSTFYDMFHMIIRRLTPPPCLPPSLLSKIHLTASLPSFPELFFQTHSQHKVTNLEPKPCLLILAFFCFFFILAALTLSALGTFAKRGGKTTCVARVEANDPSIDKSNASSTQHMPAE